MPITLLEAARSCGRGKTTILRMIKAGKLSGSRDPVTGGWLLEPAEVHRLYPPVHHGAENSAHHSAPRIAEVEARLSEKDSLIAVHERTIEDLRRRLDQADDDRRQALDRLAAAQDRIAALLTDQRTAPRRAWWPWRRG